MSVDGTESGMPTGGHRGPRHRQAVPRRGRQPRRQHHHPPRHRPRPDRGERRRQVHADEDPVRRAEAGRGHDQRRTAARSASARRPTRSRPASGMVFQHFMLADNLTVLENVVLGAEKLHGIGDKARAEIVADLRRLRLRPRPRRAGREPRCRASGSAWRSSRCSTAARRSSSSTSRPQCWCRRRSTRSSTTCASSRASGHTILFISHKLDEVLAIADDITVMRRGTTVGEADPKTATKRQLAEMMVGSELPSPETEESTVTDSRAARPWTTSA